MRADLSAALQEFEIERQRSDRYIYWLILASFGLHFLFVLATQKGWLHITTRQKQPEWVIEAELVLDYPAQGDQDALKGSKKSETLKVDQKTLPQLPKKVAIEQSEPEVAKDIIPEPEIEEKKKELTQEKSLEEPKNTLLERLRQKKEQKLVELKKEEALRRILKEKARQEKKFAKTNESPLDKTLLERKKDLIASNKFSQGKKFDSYIARITQWVKRKYVIPEVYRSSQIKKASIVLTLGPGGEIQKLSLTKSSDNSAFDQYVLKTLREAAPFPKPPAELVGVSLMYNFDPKTF